MAFKDFFRSDEYLKVRKIITERLDSQVKKLVKCNGTEDFRSLQGEILSLVWVRDHLPLQLLTEEGGIQVDPDLTPEEAMFGEEGDESEAVDPS